MVNDPYEIILDHLRALRSGQERLERDVKELKTGMASLRGDFHGFRGDLLRLENALAAVEADIDRINTRLDLVPPLQQ